MLTLKHPFIPPCQTFNWHDQQWRSTYGGLDLSGQIKFRPTVFSTSRETERPLTIKVCQPHSIALVFIDAIESDWFPSCPFFLFFYAAARINWSYSIYSKEGLFSLYSSFHICLAFAQCVPLDPGNHSTKLLINYSAFYCTSQRTLLETLYT